MPAHCIDTSYTDEFAIRLEHNSLTAKRPRDGQQGFTTDTFAILEGYNSPTGGAG